MKLAVFDLDLTLAPLDGPSLPDTLEKLRQLEAKGVRVAVCSGKSTYYLCGFMRQSGLKEPILMGELGALIQFGTDLPPKKEYFMPFPQAALRRIKDARKEMRRRGPDMFWFQPARVVMTPFFRTPEARDVAAAVLEELPQDGLLQIFEYPQCFDITPTGLDKGTAFQFLCDLLKIPVSEAAAVGDGANDIPMFHAAGLAMGINVKDPSKVHVNFPTIGDALDYLLALA